VQLNQGNSTTAIIDQKEADGWKIISIVDIKPFPIPRINGKTLTRTQVLHSYTPDK
jgi:hypothetical protein